MDERPRYHVATVSGDISLRYSNARAPMGLSAHVIDQPNACTVVATFRSEDMVQRKDRLDRPGKGRRIGNAGAIAAAEALAAEWNADNARL